MNYVFDNTQLVTETDFQLCSLLSYLDRCFNTSGTVSITEQMQWNYE